MWNKIAGRWDVFDKYCFFCLPPNYFSKMKTASVESRITKFEISVRKAVRKAKQFLSSGAWRIRGQPEMPTPVQRAPLFKGVGINSQGYAYTVHSPELRCSWLIWICDWYYVDLTLSQEVGSSVESFGRFFFIVMSKNFWETRGRKKLLLYVENLHGYKWTLGN